MSDLHAPEEAIEQPPGGRGNIIEESNGEEHGIEVDLKTAADKLVQDHTQSPYCPKCDHEITKVVLRKRERKDTMLSDTGSGHPEFGPFPISLPARTGSGHGHGHGLMAHSLVVSSDHIKKKVLESTLREILKCFVYGGRMMLILSLSVVSFAAASNATTVNVVRFGFPTVVSGLFFFGLPVRNVMCEMGPARYGELLGRRNHIVLHSSFAILSFLDFGLIPLVVYGFGFHNKDHKILAVAIVSFTCILILAAAKAYIEHIWWKRTHSNYIKTTMYYMTPAVGAWGVAYAAGHLFKVLERRGCFETQT